MSPPYIENRQNKINREEVKMNLLGGCSRRVDDTGIPSPLYASSPGLVEKDGSNTNDEKHTTNRPADDVEIVADSLNAIPERALWLCNVLDKGQDLDGTDECRHKDGDGGEDNGVVQDGDCVAGKSFRCVEGEHEGSIGGVEETHAG
ncbi:unnamed protein product [Clonostachys rhizophaga]|uniref:Uncharacterized protein n=1 Tax=Clonostachys rhizophaga TaxID=160324 RepID=A0A9N9YG12_9HYPO|nr:unnamed protein product [Clonostachys rhizophaga]